MKNWQNKIETKRAKLYFFENEVIKIFKPNKKNRDKILKDYQSPYFIKLIRTLPNGIIMERGGEPIGGKNTIKEKYKSEKLFHWLNQLQDELKEQGIVHADIKARNIVCYKDTFKLIDFGSAYESRSNHYKDKRDIRKLKVRLKICRG